MSRIRGEKNSKSSKATAIPTVDVNYLLQGDTIVFDFIIPISNSGHIDFDYRCKNMDKILAEIPKQINVIIVEQITNSKLPKYKDKIKIPETLTYTWITVSNGVFNKPWLYNIGARHAKTSRLLMSEADVMVPAFYWSHLNDWINARSYKWAFAWSKLYYQNSNGLPEKSVVPKRGYAEGGIVFFDKNFFWSIGGYNEWMRGLGGMDNEIIRRAENSSRGGRFQWTINHLWHPSSPFKSNPLRERNKIIYKAVKSNPISMRRGLTKAICHLGNTEKPVCDTLPLPI